jgi:hypothetical protein
MDDQSRKRKSDCYFDNVIDITTDSTDGDGFSINDEQQSTISSNNNSSSNNGNSSNNNKSNNHYSRFKRMNTNNSYGNYNLYSKTN